jgi:hypothetical protein
LRHFTIDCDTAIGADNGAQGAAGTVVFRVEQQHGPVAFTIEMVRQGNYIRGAGGAAKFTPLTTFNVNNDPTSGHVCVSSIDILSI